MFRLKTPGSIRQNMLAGGWKQEYWARMWGFIYIELTVIPGKSLIAFSLCHCFYTAAAMG